MAATGLGRDGRPRTSDTPPASLDDRLRRAVQRVRATARQSRAATARGDTIPRRDATSRRNVTPRRDVTARRKPSAAAWPALPEPVRSPAPQPTSQPQRPHPAETRTAEVSLVAAVLRRAGLSTWHEAHDSTAATLTALAAWLPPQLADVLADHMPGDLARAVHRGRATVAGGRDLVDFYREVANHQCDVTSLHAISLRAAAVLAVLGDTLPPAITQRLVATLPADLASLVPTRS